MKYIFYILLPFCFVTSCKEAATSELTTQTQPTPVPVGNTVPVKHELSNMPIEFYYDMKEKCEAVDYIFHNLPFSINQTDKPSVLSNLAFIGEEQADAIPAGCKPLGREFFQANGDIFLEADFYFCPPNYFSYVFIKDKKAIYANKMSEGGVRFYASLINQLKATPKS